jgi:predicted nucleotide-binding protein
VSDHERDFNEDPGLSDDGNAVVRPETIRAKGASTADSSPDTRKVFVIHGRNDAARRALFEFLRAIGLDPIEWSQAIRMTGQGSPYIGDVLDAAFSAAQAVVVLETPDDIGYLHPSLTYPDDPECDPQPQPRLNVVFEAGMAMGRNPDRTVIVEFGQVKVFSDIHGRHVVRLDNSLGKRQDLADRLLTAGCAVDTSGRDWHQVGDLTPPPPPGGGMPMGRKLPKTKTASTPRLDARYIDNGGGRLAQIEIVNHGPGDVLELDVEEPGTEGGVIRDSDDLPVPRLPEGKSIRVMHVGRETLGSRRASYFNLTAIGKTVDGSPIHEELFVSM